MAKNLIAASALSLLLGLGGAVRAAETPIGDAEEGRAYASQICAQCHDVRSRTDDALSKINPPSFYAIANAKTTNALGLNVFLITPHRNMPNLIIAERDRRNVISYILSLRNDRKSGAS